MPPDLTPPADRPLDAEVVRWSRDPHATEAMLAESQRLAKIGSFELDVATRRLTWTEQQFRNFGIEPAPVVDRTDVIRRIHPDDLNRHEAVVARAIARGEAFEMAYRVVHPDGRVVDIHTVGRPVLDAAGRVARIVGSSQDVTERKRLEEQLRAQCETLKELGELRTNFVTAVTHELRTPLTTILGYAEFLEEAAGPVLTPEHRRFVGQIHHGARRIEDLLDDLLDFACLEAGTFALRLAPSTLGAHVLAVLESLRPQSEAAHLRLEARLADGDAGLELDGRRIDQVLTNLVGNAIKFSPAGSTITVAIRVRGAVVRCEVRDAGPGIPAADHPRLFRRFSQLDAGVAARKGAGLGLSICKALVEAHGGAIGLESAPGAGSTFWFELPLGRDGSGV